MRDNIILFDGMYFTSEEELLEYIEADEGKTKEME